MVATDDPFLPRDLLQAQVVDRVAGAELSYLPGPGHYPLVSEPLETAGRIDAFLRG